MTDRSKLGAGRSNHDQDVTDQRLTDLSGRLAEVTLNGGLRVAVAESCTGGWLAKVLTDLPGSSGWFDRGVVTYSNAAKTDLLSVPESLIARDGAVSELVAIAMAEGMARISGADLTAAITGIAGPGGAVDGKPVGTVWFAWHGPRGSASRRLLFDGDRDLVRRQAVAAALEGLLEQAESL
ncbi:MAG: CinA family protein [Gammaproteobacteria bacterium]